MFKKKRVPEQRLPRACWREVIEENVEKVHAEGAGNDVSVSKENSKR